MSAWTKQRVRNGITERLCRACNNWWPLRKFEENRACCRMCSKESKGARRETPQQEQARRLGLTRMLDVAKRLGVTRANVHHWTVYFAAEIGPTWSVTSHKWFNAGQVALLTELHRLIVVEMYTYAGARRQLRLAAEREREAG